MKLNFKVSFGIDTDTEEIFDFKIIKEGSDNIPTRLECDALTFNNTTLTLNSEVLKALGIKTTNEKVALIIDMKGIQLINPRIHPVPTDGSRISKKFSISVRGKNKDVMSPYSTFDAIKMERGIVKLEPLESVVLDSTEEE